MLIKKIVFNIELWSAKRDKRGESLFLAGPVGVETALFYTVNPTGNLTAYQTEAEASRPNTCQNDHSAVSTFGTRHSFSISSPVRL